MAVLEAEYTYMHIHMAVAGKCVMAAECTLWPQTRPIISELYMATLKLAKCM